MLARFLLGVIQETVCFSKEMGTEVFSHDLAMVNFTAGRIKNIHFCMVWGTFSSGSFSRVIRGVCGTGPPVIFLIEAKTVFQNPRNLAHSHHI